MQDHPPALPSPSPSPSLPCKRKRVPQASERDDRGAVRSCHDVRGLQLDRLLESLRIALNNEIGSSLETTSKKQFTKKCKELFCVGINDVTRTLENMPRIEVSSLEEKKSRQSEEASDGANCKKRYLHAVLVAMDAHPHILVGHLPSLASSRGVPFFALSGGNGTGSLKLGAVFRMRTALAVGVKVANSSINNALESFMAANGA